MTDVKEQRKYHRSHFMLQFHSLSGLVAPWEKANPLWFAFSTLTIPALTQEHSELEIVCHLEAQTLLSISINPDKPPGSDPDPL